MTKIYTTLDIDIHGTVATVWLNRPAVHNAFNEVMIAEITGCFAELNHRDDIRVVLLRGREKSFCAGADLNWMRDVAKQSYQENFEESRKLAACFLTLYTCNKPTIALVHGVALGGANGLLSACDMTYCVDDATFSLSEVKIGIVPACISPYVIKRIGEPAARDLMITGKRIKGKEAESYRLVSRSFPDMSSMENYVNDVIETIKTSGPEAVSMCKKLIFDVVNKLSFDEVHDYTAKMIADIRASKEGQEGMSAFLEKRKPNWVKS
jgi:methylglutaconyl-CoA hydratase